jgi:enoyl-CoA hydratase/carnithine racemase
VSHLIVEQGDVAVIRLNHGVTNAITGDLIGELSEALDEAAGASSALVLTSANAKFFSIGFNLPELLAFDREAMGDFYRAFNRLCLKLHAFPRPTVAAIPGHAVAGGCILAICCDIRVISEGKKFMGLNEIHLGVPVPYASHCILSGIVGPRTIRQIEDGGELFLPEALEAMGLVDRVLPPEAVIDGAKETAKTLGKLPEKAFAVQKRNRVEGIRTQALAGLEAKAEDFLDCWFSEGTREKLREAAEKF